RTVVAAFKHRAQAQRAVDALLDAGFAQTQIAIEATEEWHHYETEATLEQEAMAAEASPPTAGRWPVPAGAFLGGAVGGGAAWLARRGRPRWQRGGWTRGQVGMVAAGALVGAAGGMALLTAWRRGEAPALPDDRAGASYDQGSLERGHAIVTVAPGERLAEAEGLLRAFGGRGVHVRMVEPEGEAEGSGLDATARVETFG